MRFCKNSKVSYANKNKTMRTTVPREIVSLMNLENQDSLLWCMDIKEDGYTVTLEVMPNNNKKEKLE